MRNDGSRRNRCARRIAADAHRFFSFGNLDFRNTGVVEQFDQFFYFSDVHL